MSFIRTKEIPPGSGHFYSYRQTSKRIDGKVTTVFLGYIGPAPGGGTGTASAIQSNKPSLGITRRKANSDKLIARLSLIQGIKKQPIQELETELASTSMTLALLKDADNNDPARPFIGIIQRSGDDRGEISQLTIKQYREYMKREPNPSILTTDGKHVQWEYAMDDMAKTLGFTGNNADVQFRQAIYDAKDRHDKIKQVEYELAAMDREIVERKSTTPSYEMELERQKAIDTGATEDQIKEFDAIISDFKSCERFEELEKINATREPASIKRDNAKLNENLVIEPTDPRTERWEVQPGQLDINGIDTPRETPKPEALGITPLASPTIQSTFGGVSSQGSLLSPPKQEAETQAEIDRKQRTKEAEAEKTRLEKLGQADFTAGETKNGEVVKSTKQIYKGSRVWDFTVNQFGTVKSIKGYRVAIKFDKPLRPGNDTQDTMKITIGRDHLSSRQLRLVSNPPIEALAKQTSERQSNPVKQPLGITTKEEHDPLYRAVERKDGDIIHILEVDKRDRPRILKNIKSSFSDRQYEYMVADDGMVEVYHAVTGRQMGTIDEEGNPDSPKLQAFADKVNLRVLQAQGRIEADLLHNRPNHGDNPEIIKALENITALPADNPNKLIIKQLGITTRHYSL